MPVVSHSQKRKKCDGIACSSSARCACARCRKMVTEAMVMCVVTSVNNTICHQVASAHRPSLANRSNVSHIELKSVIRSHSRLGERWRTEFIVGDRYNRVIEG